MYFYDTCALLHLQERAFTDMLYISPVTLRELEDIKSSGKKSEEVRAQARGVTRLLAKYWDTLVNIAFTSDTEYTTWRVAHGISDTPDMRIIYDCYMCQQDTRAIDDCPAQFVTEDLCCEALARLYGVEVGEFEDNQEDNYTGYLTVQMNDDEMADFYSNPCENKWGLLVNQYMRVLDADGELVDTRRWDGKEFVRLYGKGIKSMAFGDKLKARDEYQAMAIDSIMNNTLTLLSGKAGSGKSLIALASIFSMIEKGTVYDKVVIMTNPCKVRGAADMGFYSGDSQKKIMQNSLGNILITKFGDRFIVDNLISQGKMKIMSLADCRGMEIRDNEILYITESQNMSIDMIKLVLERASSGCKVVLDGDFDAQVDSWAYEGRNNGMRRVVEALKGEDLFGYVELANVWRSKLAALAQKL